jgi:hypothetical protein
MACGNVGRSARLVTCRSYSMDQIIGQALTEFRRIEESVSRKERRELCLQVEGPSPPPPERLL